MLHALQCPSMHGIHAWCPWLGWMLYSSHLVDWVYSAALDVVDSDCSTVGSPLPFPKSSHA